MKAYTFENIKLLLPENYKIVGELSKIIFSNIKTIFEADSDSLVWLNPTRTDKSILLLNTLAKIIICDLNTEIVDTNKIYIQVKNPKLVFLRIVDELFSKKILFEVHPTSVLHPEAIIHPNVHIGPFNIIGKVIIGENTIIKSHCFIADQTIIGNNVTIQHNNTIGSDGFGYSKNENGEFEKFPHIGGVIIEDFVEIGSNSCIDRGTLGNTIIKKGAKIDNLVHIAHNVEIGENCCIVANAMIGGSTKIENNTWISPSASLRDGIIVGEGSTLGMGAVLVKSQPSQSVWAGNPAKQLNDIIAYNKAISDLLSKNNDNFF
jgi:UDP-3-O-[3-hydroxymyristoyl] glucosamine N-acyltransferase